MNHRNGYRARPFDTRVGSVELAIPKLRRGSYFPDWLLDPRRRAERALVAVVAEARPLCLNIAIGDRCATTPKLPQTERDNPTGSAWRYCRT